MRALLSENINGKVLTRLTDIPTPECQDNQVLIKVHYSSINYKDALAVTGRGLIFKNFPIVGGIDCAGIVLESKSAKFKINDPVLVTGCGLGETHNGGYGEFIIEDAINVIPLPKNLSLKEAMIFGTAGFTAGLCYERISQNGQTPAHGPLVITGASGGVGQFGISIFSKMGYEVIAVSSKKESYQRLLELGATTTVSVQELNLSTRPLEKIRFGGAIDNVGGELLANLTHHIELWGNIVCVGLADSPNVNLSVMPLILRGVSLIGISSNNTPRALREKIWQNLSSNFKPKNLDNFVTAEIELKDILEFSNKMLSRNTTGRILVRI